MAPFILLTKGPSSKVAMKELWTGEPTNMKKNNSGMRNAQQRGNIDTKSPNEICRPEFSSSSMLRGQVAGWCIGRERKWKRPISLEGKVLLNRRSGHQLKQNSKKSYVAVYGSDRLETCLT